jgi:transposase
MLSMKTFGLRPRRDFAALENRRMKAVRLFEQGHPQAEVVRLLKVSRPSAHRWYHSWVKKGREALKAAGRAGRKPRLSTKDQKQLGEAILRGPQAHGFSTHLWTLERVAWVIEKTCGVKYHPCHVSRILRNLGFSRQRPKRQALQKDEKAVKQWVSRHWVWVKKTPDAMGLG